MEKSRRGGGLIPLLGGDGGVWGWGEQNTVGFLARFQLDQLPNQLGGGRGDEPTGWAGEGKGPKRAQNNQFPQEAMLPVHPVQPSTLPLAGMTSCPPRGERGECCV